MNNADFVKDALRTESPVNPEMLDRLISLTRVIHAIFGMLTELGELADVYKKYIFYGKPIDLVNVKEEFGDKFWYDAIFSDATGIAFDDSMTTVIQKLRKRYPEKFTQEAALIRNLDAERAVLSRGFFDPENSPGMTDLMVAPELVDELLQGASHPKYSVGDLVTFLGTPQEVKGVCGEYVQLVLRNGGTDWIHESEVTEVVEED